jgi:hypothetical protein
MQPHHVDGLGHVAPPVLPNRSLRVPGCRDVTVTCPFGSTIRVVVVVVAAGQEGAEGGHALIVRTRSDT